MKDLVMAAEDLVMAAEALEGQYGRYGQWSRSGLSGWLVKLIMDGGFALFFGAKLYLRVYVRFVYWINLVRPLFV